MNFTNRHSHSAEYSENTPSTVRTACSAECKYPAMLSLKDTVSSIHDAKDLTFEEVNKGVVELKEGLSTVRKEADESAKESPSQLESCQGSLQLPTTSPGAISAGGADVRDHLLSPHRLGFTPCASAASRDGPSLSPLGSKNRITVAAQAHAEEVGEKSVAKAWGGASSAECSVLDASGADADALVAETPRVACLQGDNARGAFEATTLASPLLAAASLAPAPDSQAQKLPQPKLPEVKQTSSSDKQHPPSDSSKPSSLRWKDTTTEPATVTATTPEVHNAPPQPTKDASAADSRTADSCTPGSDALTQQPSWADVNRQASAPLSVSPGTLPPVKFSAGDFPSSEPSPTDAVVLYSGEATEASPFPTPPPRASNTGQITSAPPTEYHTPMPSLQGELTREPSSLCPGTVYACTETPANVSFECDSQPLPNAQPLFPKYLASIARQAHSTAAPPPPPPPLPPPPSRHVSNKVAFKPPPVTPPSLARISTSVKQPPSPTVADTTTTRSLSLPPPVHSPAAPPRTLSHQGSLKSPHMLSPPVPRPPLPTQNSMPGTPPSRPLTSPRTLPLPFFDANGVALLRKGNGKKGAPPAPGSPTLAGPPGSPQLHPRAVHPPLPNLPFTASPRMPQQCSPVSNLPLRPFFPQLAPVDTQPRSRSSLRAPPAHPPPPHASQPQPKYFSIASLQPGRQSGGGSKSSSGTGAAHSHTTSSRSCRSPPLGQPQSMPAEQLVQHLSLPGCSSSGAQQESPLGKRHSMPVESPSQATTAIQPVPQQTSHNMPAAHACSRTEEPAFSVPNDAPFSDSPRASVTLSLPMSAFLPNEPTGIASASPTSPIEPAAVDSTSKKCTGTTTSADLPSAECSRASPSSTSATLLDHSEESEQTVRSSSPDVVETPRYAEVSQKSRSCTLGETLSNVNMLSGLNSPIRTSYSDDYGSTPSPFVSGLFGAIQQSVSAATRDSTGNSTGARSGSLLDACRPCMGNIGSVVDFSQGQSGTSTAILEAQASNASVGGYRGPSSDGCGVEITLRRGIQDSTQLADVHTTVAPSPQPEDSGSVGTGGVTPRPPVDSELSPRLQRQLPLSVKSEVSEGEASGGFGELTLTVPSPLGSGSQMAPIAGQTPASEKITEALRDLKEQIALDGGLFDGRLLRQPSQSPPGEPIQVLPEAGLADENETAAAVCQGSQPGEQQKESSSEAARGKHDPTLSVDVPDKAGEACNDQAPDLSPAGGVLDAPKSPFFEGSPWGGSIPESHEGGGARAGSVDLRDLSGMRQLQRVMSSSQVTDSDALRTFLQDAEEQAAAAEARLQVAEERFKELMSFFSQPLKKDKAGVCLQVCSS